MDERHRSKRSARLEEIEQREGAQFRRMVEGVAAEVWRETATGEAIWHDCSPESIGAWIKAKASLAKNCVTIDFLALAYIKASRRALSILAELKDLAINDEQRERVAELRASLEAALRERGLPRIVQVLSAEQQRYPNNLPPLPDTESVEVATVLRQLEEWCNPFEMSKRFPPRGVNVVFGRRMSVPEFMRRIDADDRRTLSRLLEPLAIKTEGVAPTQAHASAKQNRRRRSKEECESLVRLYLERAHNADPDNIPTLRTMEFELDIPKSTLHNTEAWKLWGAGRGEKHERRGKDDGECGEE